MSVIRSAVSPSSTAFAENTAQMAAAVETVESAANLAMQGGGEGSRQRHLARGKLLPRDRIRELLDPGSPFLETGLFAAHNMYDRAVPCAGLITGIGKIEGRQCMIVCNDATVKVEPTIR